MKVLYTAIFLWAMGASGIAQCEDNEVALSFLIGTDAWGYEMYWEVVPSGNGCGNGTLFSNGNPDVGCEENGGGTGEIYASNSTFDEGPFCVTAGDTLDFIYVDSYGDGGMTVALFMDGIFSGNWGGTGDGNTWTFVVGESLLIDHDTPCSALPVEVDGDVVAIVNAGGSVEPGEPSPIAAPTGSCALPGTWCGSDGNINRTVWLSFEASTTDPVEVSSCNDGTNMDSQLAVYRAESCGDFDSYELIASNDDVPGGCAVANGYASVLRTSCLEVGQLYLIQLDGWGGAEGTSWISVTTSSADLESGLLAQVSNISCPLDKDTSPNGLIAPYVASGVSDFEIEWTGPSGFTSSEAIIGGLVPGEYAASVVTACGNAFNQSWEITAPASWSVTTGAQDATCEEALNGSAYVEVSGATGPYDIIWNGPNVEDTEGDMLDNLAGGTYQVLITDNNNCTYETAIVVESASTDEFTIGADTTICENESLLVYAPAGYDYAWQDGSINQFYYIQPGDYAPGTYSIIVTASDDAGCSFADAMLLTVFNCTTGVGHVDDDIQPTVFPVPAFDRLYLDGIPSDAQHRIVDARGREVWSGRGPQSEIYVETWGTGLYFWIGEAKGLQWKQPLVVE